MTPAELITAVRSLKPEPGQLTRRQDACDLVKVLHALADVCRDATTKQGLHLLDQSDFAQWLRELAEEAEK